MQLAAQVTDYKTADHWPLSEQKFPKWPTQNWTSCDQYGWPTKLLIFLFYTVSNFISVATVCLKLTCFSHSFHS